MSGGVAKFLLIGRKQGIFLGALKPMWQAYWDMVNLGI